MDPTLLSSDFVATGGLAAKSLGRHPLKGVAVDQQIFEPLAEPIGDGR